MANGTIDANEIIVRAEQTPGQVSFYNYAELKEYLEKGISVYNTTEYTEENIDQAKADLKELTSIKKKLEVKKKELENAYSLPIEEVRKQLDELIGMVKEPMKIIDEMIKNKEKQDKKQVIMDYANRHSETLGEYAGNVVNSGAFFNNRWLNKTCTSKEWMEDIDKKIQDAADAIETIDQVGGNNKGALLGFYFNNLSLDGSDEFLKIASSDLNTDVVSEVDDKNAVVGYKVIKIYGTERQMFRFMSMLDISDMEYEEIEDGMPKEMEELTSPEFDSFVAFDIEHTGTKGFDKGDAEAEIIEIGAVKVVNGEIVDRFDMLANPGRDIIPRIVRLTHITNEMVAGEPSVDEVIKKFKDFVGDSVLVGHNIKSCDIPHITRAAKRAGVNFDNAFFDTKKLASKLKESKGWENVKLPFLSKFYNVQQEEAHRAWCDAKANAEVFLKMKEELK